MQLKLATAREQAERMRLRAPTTRDLLERPELNVRLGTGYLTRLIDRFEGRAFLGLAAYNAGATPTRRWAQAAPLGDALATERIGYGQAHEYVKNILGIRQSIREMRPREERGAGR
jgi:soluble lytic murein transglycosylase